MVDAFLGTDYDPAKFSQVDELQKAMVTQQARLAEQYEKAEIGPAEYVDSFNATAYDSFEKIERVLGKDDYLKLFGPPPDKSIGFINKQLFFEAHEQRLIQSLRITIGGSKHLVSYANYVRVTGTPEEVIIDFGINTQSQHSPTVTSDRMIISFFTAKRLMQTLAMALQRHEQAFGILETDVRKRLVSVDAGEI